MATQNTPDRERWARARPAAEPAAEEDEHESHEPPRGALLIICGYLVLIVGLWLQVYLQLLSNGGVIRP
ncbi:MAG: hypothetical protein RMK84_08120 [Oscillochloridaceae bacterium]|nr:hypothetical protein [Chloroflexaceae bacterium]MDW8390078.1 hypothetical protein [Oscillochloridaceae bacterium]